MNEKTRLKVIDEFTLNHDLPLDLDDLMMILAEAYRMPIALIGIAGEYEERYKASYGLDTATVNLEDTLCSTVVNTGEQLIVNDARQDPRFQNSPIVTGSPRICFYFGTPISVEGETVGALCLIDTTPREIDEKHAKALARIATLISQHIALSHEHEVLKREHGLIEKSPIVLATWRFETSLNLIHISQNCEHVLGVSSHDLLSGAVQLNDIMSNTSENDFTFTMQAHMEGVETHTCRLQVISPTRTIWVSMISTASFREDGSLLSVQAFLFDTSDQKFVEDKLNKTNSRMRLLLEASELGTWDWNLQADVNQVNKRWCEIVGLEYEYYDTSARFFKQLIHPADFINVDKKLNEHLCGESKVFNTQFRMQHSDGRWVWVETYGKIVETDDVGKPVRVAGIHRDITQRMENEIHERKKTQLLQFINKTRASYLKSNDLTAACQSVLSELIELSDSQIAFIGQMRDVDSQPRLFIHAISEIVWDSESFTQYNEYKKRNLYFSSFDNLFGQAITSGEVVISNTAGTHPASKGTPQGHPRISRFLGLPIKVKERVVGIIGLANKFSAYSSEDAEFFQPLLDALAGLFYAVDLEQARADAEEKLRKLAMTDSLTGLYNRRAFIEQCENMAKEHCSIIVVLIDIDHFKSVNDTFGHDAGDCALKQTSGILSDFVSDGELVARLGGEEFGVVMRDLNKIQAQKRLELLRKRVEAKKMRYKKDTLKVTVSMGATSVDDGFDMDFSALLSLADQALYDAKTNGRNRIEWRPCNKLSQ